MLNRARKKFVIWAMVAMTVTLLVLIAAVNLVNWFQEDRRLNTALQEISEAKCLQIGAADGKSGNGTGGHGRQSALTQYGSRFFIALVRSDGQITLQQSELDTVDQTAAEALVQKVIASGADGGYLDSYKYLVTSTDAGEAVCFLDCSTELTAVNSLLTTSLLVGALGLVLSFLFIFRMSVRVVEPVRQSMEKQKQFITNAGHELKTPLSVIGTNMDILTMDLGENEWVEGTKKQVGKLRRLVGSLISLSKLEEGESEAALQCFSLSDAVSECVGSFEGLAGKSGKTFAVSIQDGLTIRGDPAMVQQLVSILCDNAVKYAVGEEPIGIRLYASGRTVCFETANDWAHNVDEKDLNRLFERFYRGDLSRSSEAGAAGYGLGLSIAQALAEKNHARISVQTDERQRLVFTVVFRPQP